MALRLSTPGSPQAAPQSSPPASAERLVARAQATLLARDFKGYRALFDEAGAIEDVHRRHHARKQLVEQGLAAAGARRRATDLPHALPDASPARAPTLLDENPREPYLLNYLGVALYELGALEAAESLFRAALRLDETVPHVEQQPRARSRASAASAARAVPVAAGACAPRSSRSWRRARDAAEQRTPRRGPDAEPLHDRQGRGGDAAAHARGRRSGRRRDHRRRHRLDRPHRRDRRVVRREGAPPRVDRRLRRRPQRLARSRDRRLDRLARRRRGARGRGRRRAARAHRPDLARGVLPRRDQLHGRPRGRHRGHPQRPARVPQPPRVPLRGPPARAARPRTCRATSPERIESHAACASSTTATWASCATRRTSRAATSSCSSASRPRASTPPYHNFNLGSEYLALGEWDKACRLPHARVEGDGGRARAARTTRTCRRSRAALVIALRECRPPRRGRTRSADAGLDAVPGLHRPRLPAGVGRARRAATSTAARARCSSAASRWATRPSKYSATVGCGSYLALMALAALRRRGRGAGATCSPAASTSTPPSTAPCSRSPPRCSRSGSEPDEVVAAIESRVAKRHRHACASCSAPRSTRRAPPTDAERQFRAVLEQQPGSGPARVALGRGACSRSAATTRPPRSPPRSPADDPCAAAARRSRALRAARGRAARRRPRRALDRRRRRPAAPPTSPSSARWLDAAHRRRAARASCPRDAAPLLTATLEALLRVRRSTPSPCSCRCVDRVGHARARAPRAARLDVPAPRLPRVGRRRVDRRRARTSGPDAPALTGLALVAAARELREDALVFAREATASSTRPTRRPRCSSGISSLQPELGRAAAGRQRAVRRARPARPCCSQVSGSRVEYPIKRRSRRTPPADPGMDHAGIQEEQWTSTFRHGRNRADGPGAAHNRAQAAAARAARRRGDRRHPSGVAPPAACSRRCAAAAKVADSCVRQARELHFEPTADGRVTVQVRDLDGNVIRTIPPAEGARRGRRGPLD